MKKVIEISELQKLMKKIENKKSKTVLVGGCFDILHVGHIRFLQKAKNKGDFLILFLESDERVEKLKGKKRPLFSQKERALVLSQLNPIDQIIIIPAGFKDEDYERLITKIKPDVIAFTQNDPLTEKKERQAKKINAKRAVIPYFKTHSTSNLIRILGVD